MNGTNVSPSPGSKYILLHDFLVFFFPYHSQICTEMTNLCNCNLRIFVSLFYLFSIRAQMRLKYLKYFRWLLRFKPFSKDPQGHVLFFTLCDVENLQKGYKNWPCHGSHHCCENIVSFISKILLICTQLLVKFSSTSIEIVLSLTSASFKIALWVYTTLLSSLLS